MIKHKGEKQHVKDMLSHVKVNILKDRLFVDVVMNKILRKWQKVESKMYIPGVLGWLNSIVKEELESALSSQKKELISEVCLEIACFSPLGVKDSIKLAKIIRKI